MTQQNIEKVHSEYAEKRSTLTSLLESTKSLLADLLKSTDIGLPDSPLNIVAPNLYGSSDFLSKALAHKLKDSILQLDRLHSRISDTKSRVLVTGDVNAGKSTFVNAMLRKEVVPDDQQPCTSVFVEVINAHENGGLEEVHGILDSSLYSPLKESSFTRIDYQFLRQIVESNEENYQLLKVYCRTPPHSLLTNGIVDISLIDSPGLNIDVAKTAALFNEQNEIDVIVFIANAENHFTQSTKEFLEIAGKEKVIVIPIDFYLAYIFFVINRFDLIKRKDRCKKDILSQIAAISPTSHQDASNLVHFVSAKQCLQQNSENFSEEFQLLEDCLRTFILDKRTKSKLAPAKHYLINLLTDIKSIAQHNIILVQNTIKELARVVEKGAPKYDKLLEIKETTLYDVDKTVEDKLSNLQSSIQSELNNYISNIPIYVKSIQWPGMLKAYDYSRDVRVYLSKLMTLKIKKVILSHFFIECEFISIEQVQNHLEKLEKLSTSFSSPVQIDPSSIQSAFESDIEKSMATQMPLELSLFFNTTDKIELLKEVLPGVLLLSIGGVSLNLGIPNKNIYFVQLTTNDISGTLIVFGMGYIYYVFSDIKRSLYEKMITKMQMHVASSMFVDNTTERLVKASRRLYRSIYWEFQNQFQKTFLETQNERDNNLNKFDSAQKRELKFHSIFERASDLLKTVQAIEMDDVI